MVYIFYKKWDENKDLLKKEIEAIENIGYLSYLDLVKMTFSTIYNNREIRAEYPYEELDCENITEIDNGDYQGTLVYLIPFNNYQPNESQYLMTYVDYGSCTCCDTLLGITQFEDGRPSAQQVSDLLTLCRDIVMHTIKPYNAGFNYSMFFDTVDF